MLSAYEQVTAVRVLQLKSRAVMIVLCLLGAVLDVGVLCSVGWTVDQHRGHLHLAGGIEGDDSDVCVWERPGAVVDLCQHLTGVVAAKHRQLVHGPVPAQPCLISAHPTGFGRCTVLGLPCSPVVHVVGVHCTPDVVGVEGLDVSVLWLRKLKTGGPVVLDDIVHLPGNLICAHGWQERKGLEHPARRRQVSDSCRNRDLLQ